MFFIFNLKKEIISYLYPDNLNCINCNKSINKRNKLSLCKECYEKLEYIKNPCMVCSKEMPNNYKQIKCPICMENNFYFNRNISIFKYNDIISKIIYKYKYNYDTYISNYISDIIIDKIDFMKLDFDYILYVPLSKQRYKKRGFNQSRLIAKNLEKYYNKKILDILKRNKNTKFLSGLKKEERKKELKNAFLVNKDYRNILSNKTIIVIDDIFTTGSTLNEISKTLCESFDLKFIFCVTFTTGNNM